MLTFLDIDTLGVWAYGSPKENGCFEKVMQGIQGSSAGHGQSLGIIRQSPDS